MGVSSILGLVVEDPGAQGGDVGVHVRVDVVSALGGAPADDADEDAVEGERAAGVTWVEIE